MAILSEFVHSGDVLEGNDSKLHEQVACLVREVPVSLGSAAVP